jgi:hypothetical protein
LGRGPTPSTVAASTDIRIVGLAEILCSNAMSHKFFKGRSSAGDLCAIAINVGGVAVTSAS